MIFDEKLFLENKAVDKIKGDSKFFFKYVKNLRVASSSPSVLVDCNKDAITDPKRIADMLQDQFRSVFSSPLTNSELENHSKFNPPVFDPIQPFQITKQHVIEAIDEIKANSSCTCYDIPAVVLKQCKYALCEPIKLFIEKSFLYGEIPLKYKFQTI